MKHNSEYCKYCSVALTFENKVWHFAHCKDCEPTYLKEKAYKKKTKKAQFLAGCRKNCFECSYSDCMLTD